MKKQIDMVNGNILSGMFRFAIPLIISSVLQVLYNSADTFIVGAYDDPLSMGAVGSANGIINCVVQLFIGISVGVNILAARFYGAGDMSAVKRYGRNGLILGAVFGIFVCCLGLLLAEPLVEFIGVAPEIRVRTLTYIRIYMIGVPFSAMFNFVSAFLQGTGDTRRPTKCLVISGAVNVVLNVVFVKYMGMGVAGVATATVVSLAIAFLLAFRAFAKSSVGVKLKEVKFESNFCRNIIAMGLPVGLQNLLNSVSNIFTTSAMNKFGSAAISGEAIELQMESLLCVGVSGISAAIITFVSQNMGAGKYDRLGKIFKTGFTIQVIYCLAGTTIAYLLRVPFVEMFAHGDQTVAMYAYKKINFIIVPFVTIAIADAPSGMLRGIGGTFPAMLISMGGCLFRIAWIVFLLPLPQLYSVEFLFLSYPIMWTASGIVAFIVYSVKKKKLVQRAKNYKKVQMA